MSGSPPPFLRFDPAAQSVLAIAQRTADERGVPAIDSIALLLALLDASEGASPGVFAVAGVGRDRLVAAAERCRGERPLILADQPVTTVRDVVRSAMEAAESRSAKGATIDDIAVALLAHGSGLANEALRDLGLDPVQLAQDIQNAPPRAQG